VRQIEVLEKDIELSNLLDEVERGESLLISRHGRIVARLTPQAETGRAPPEDIARIIDEMKEAAARRGAITVEELLSARDEGRR
jgi:prevent-host-death family protein